MADSYCATKRCTTCGEHKPRECFSKKKDRPDGLYSLCKECKRASDKAGREKYLQKCAGAIIPDEKACKKCGIVKPSALFTRQKDSLDGLYYWCSDCKNEHERGMYHKNKDHISALRKIWRNENKEHLAAQKREYRLENRDRIKANLIRWRAANREKWLEGKRRRYLKNRETHLAQCDEYRRKNLELFRRIGKRWRENNPEKVKANLHKRRAREKLAIGAFSGRDVKLLLERQRWKCACCRSKLIKYHVDHIIPLAKGGSNYPGNIQALCPTCNLSKGSKDPIEFMQRMGMLL